MSNTLRQARILSSENDASVKQEQNTNVNIKITPQRTNQSQPSTPMNYPSIPPIINGATPPPMTTPPMTPPPVNFTMPQQMDQSTYPSVQATDRGISDLTNEMESLEKKNQFLEMIVAMYESNPLKINSYVVCESKLLMNMIKLLTDADKVELVIDDSADGCGCGAISSKFIKIDKILVFKNSKSEELKYGYNDIYTQFIRYGVSMKLVV